MTLSSQSSQNADPRSSGQHPDFAQETAYLLSTLKTIESELSQRKDRIPGTGAGDAWAGRKLREMERDFIEQLNSALAEPYFGRIDFKGDDEEHFTPYYIGKAGIPDVVIDWRAPIASLYYGHTGGRKSYRNDARDIISGFLRLIRYFDIKNAQLLGLSDIYNEDLHQGTNKETLADEFLLQHLNKNADSMMRDIVATIQQEQDEVIRASKDGVVVVQGVAGSGKSLVALHRIAYLVYTYPQDLRPGRILSIAPNEHFLDYIKALLPSLNVAGVEQSVFTKWALAKMDGAVSLTDRIQDSPALRRWKGSRGLILELNQWVPEFVDRIFPQEDLVIDGREIISVKKLRTWFQTGGLSLVRNQLANLLKDNHDNRKKLANGDPIPPSVARLGIDHFDRVILGLENYTRLVANKKLPLQAWFEFTETPSCLDSLPDRNFNGELSASATRIKQGIAMASDLPILCYLKDKLYGLSPEERYDYIVVDEAQDLSPLQLAVLAGNVRNFSMTLVGDLAQALTPEHETRTWQELLNNIIPKDQVQLFLFAKSYRSTRQIVGLARRVLENTRTQFPLPEPVLRDGPEPLLLSFPGEKEMLQHLADTISSLNPRFRSLAVIIPTRASAMKVDALIKSVSRPGSLEITVATPEEAKGLEYDVVAVLYGNAYHTNDLDAKRLYTALTRALHELYVFGVKSLTPLIPNPDDHSS